MKVLVATTLQPFVRGGAELLADTLVRELNDTQGVSAELLRIPFAYNSPEALYEQMVLWRSVEVVNVDRVICLKFPAYLLPHPSKTVWLMHQFRQVYDLWDEVSSNRGASDDWNKLKKTIHAIDTLELENVRSLFTFHAESAERLLRFNGIRSDTLVAPFLDPELFTPGASGEYVFVGGRINRHKRQHLAVEAMKSSSGSYRMVVAGPPDSEQDVIALKKIIEKYKLEDRVILRPENLSRNEYANLVRNAGAVCYLPFQEDSMGYVSMEAALAGRPVVTVSDAGGVLDLVLDKVTGLVAKPNPESLAKTLDQVMSMRKDAESLGRAAHKAVLEKTKSWPETIDRLLA